jgi:hypothetical protein
MMSPTRFRAPRQSLLVFCPASNPVARLRVLAALRMAQHCFFRGLNIDVALIPSTLADRHTNSTKLIEAAEDINT